MNWISNLFSKKLKCAVCHRTLYRLGNAQVDQNHPFYDLIQKGIVLVTTEHTAHQCTKCKRVVCQAHAKQEVWNAAFGVQRCAFCGMPVEPLE
jgi:hypothetical protein